MSTLSKTKPDPPTPIGYLWHWSSGKVICPANTKNGFSELIFSNEISADYQFRFVEVMGAGHFGYIKHVKSGGVVLPNDSPSGTLNDSSDNRAPMSLIVQPHEHAGALFGFDRDNMLILHRNGKVWCSEGGHLNPTLSKSAVKVVLTSNQSDAAKFFFGNKDRVPISPFPTPERKGDWNLLRAFITPLADHTYNQTYKIGRSKSETDMSQRGWSVSAQFAMGLFSGKGEYSNVLQLTSNETWSEEKEESYTIRVSEGKSVFVWQYTFSLCQYGEEVKFLSSIIGDTDDVNKKPVIPLIAKK